MIWLGLAVIATVSLGLLYLHKSLIKKAEAKAFEEAVCQIQQSFQKTKDDFDKKVSDAQKEIIEQRQFRDSLPNDWPAESVIVFEAKDNHSSSEAKGS